MKLRQVPYSGAADSRIVYADSGEDIARISGPQDKERSCIAFPDAVAKEIVRAVNNRPNLIRQLDEYEERLGKQRAEARKLKPLDLKHLSRDSDKVFTHIRLEDFDLREHLSEKRGDVKHLLNWIELGACDLRASGDGSFIGGRLRSGITDFEHDSAYLLYINLIGIQFMGCWHNVSHFEAYLSTNPKDIKVYPSDFVPEEVEGAVECDNEHCEKHLLIEKFTPPVYEFAHLVAGKKVAITMGPCWGSEDES